MAPLRVKKDKSLCARIPWLRLLHSLDVEVNSSALPADVVCPICGADAMQVIADRQSDCEWFSCSACNQAGDAIELAAKTWKISIVSAVRELAREGFDLPTEREAVQSYVERYIQFRKRMQRLWRQSRDHFHNSTTLPGLVHKLRLHYDMPKSRWQLGPGQLFGGIDAKRIEAAYYPRAMQTKGASKPFNPSARRIFQGRGWGDVLVLPFRDAPGRICGFYFVGRDGKVTQDRIYRAANYGKRGGGMRASAFVEAGLHFHPDALNVADRRWRETVFAIRDPIMALKLHLRHFEGSTLPLPLFLWQDVDPTGGVGLHVCTKEAWRLVAPRRTVFWMPTPDLATLRRAADCNGYVSVAGPRTKTKKALEEFLWRREPSAVLKLVAKQAVPWWKVFSDMVEDLPPRAIEQLVRQMRQSGTDVTQLADRLPSVSRRRLVSALDRKGVPRIIPYNSKRVTEENQRWYATDNRERFVERVLDGILRVDRVIYHNKAQKTYLEGRLLIDDDTIHFCEQKEIVETKTLEWLQELARIKGHVILRGRKSWSYALLEIAFAMHAPEYVDGADTVGWSAQKIQFTLPHYTIKIRGKVEPAAGSLFGEDAPGYSLEQPRNLTPDDFNSVQADSKLSQTFWSCLLPMVSNIVAPAFAHHPSGIGLVGASASWVGMHLSGAIGCPQHLKPGASTMDRLYAAEFLHNWPIFVGSQHQSYGKWWASWVNESYNGYRNCVCAMDQLHGMLKAVRGGWHVVVGDQAFLMPGGWKPLAAKLLPAYLLDLAKRDFKMRDADHRSSWLEEVSHDLATFVELSGGDPTPLRTSLSRIWPDVQFGHAKAFAHVLGVMVRGGHLMSAPTGFERRKMTLIRRRDGMYIPEAPVRDYLFAKHHVLPEHDDISKALSLEGVLRDDSEDGWLIDEAWWLRTQKRENQLLPSPGV
jgi:hypothetical protein